MLAAAAAEFIMAQLPAPGDLVAVARELILQLLRGQQELQIQVAEAVEVVGLLLLRLAVAATAAPAL